MGFAFMGNILKAFRFITELKPSLTWTSETDCRTPQECLKRILSCIISIERCKGSLHFNHVLCETFMGNYLLRARDLLEGRKDEIETYGEQCFNELTALHHTVKEAEFFIHKHCMDANWIKAAVELVENTSAFAEIILDLNWYMNALGIAIEVATGTASWESTRHKVWDLQNRAMTEYVKLHDSWEEHCKELSLLKDRRVLLTKLNCDHARDVRCLSTYLARKLAHPDLSVHARAPLHVNLRSSELLRNSVFLGGGAYGTVDKVQWLGMLCAVKQIPNKTDVDEEVRILSKLHHPNIIQLYGYFIEERTLYLIMELMESNLCTHVMGNQWREVRMSPHFLHAAFDCMLQIAKGMRYLHSKGMAHRDLKGLNVLVKPSENRELQSKGYLTVKLTDFGMAKANLQHSTYTAQSMNVGTPAWKAPELFKWYSSDSPKHNLPRERKYYPFKADVYSFGMVCYEILCGSIPFSNETLTPRSVFYAKVKGGIRPELPEESLKVVPGLSDYIKLCWDTDPCRRPDFVNICKRIRHFRDYLLKVDAYSGWERKALGSERIVEELITIDDDELIDADEWDWEIDYKDVVRVGEALRASSGFSSVWIAQWKKTSEKVLVKFIEPTLIDNEESIANFKREVELLVRLRHPNLVHYLGATKQAQFVVLTQLAPGVMLRNFLNKKPTVSPSDAVSIALQVALGIASLHGEQVLVVHGELSPDCIVIDEQTMTVRVADFGMQRFRLPPQKHCQPRWYRRAPEQRQGLSLHPSCDVFSFGMIVYELLEHEKAQAFWKHKKASKMVLMGHRPPLQSASRYPRGMKTLIEKCWAHKWEDRPNFEAIVSALQKTVTHQNRLSSSSCSSSSRRG